MGPKAPEPLWTQDGSSAPLPHCREPPMPKPGTRVCVLMDTRSHGDDVVMLASRPRTENLMVLCLFFLATDLRESG